MMLRRRHRLDRIAILSACLLCQAAGAQSEEEEKLQVTGDEPVDEIVVLVDRSGDPVIDFDLRQQEILRQKILDEYFRLQALEEESEWRRADPDLEIKNTSRIRWGYNPQAEMRMRRDSDFMDLPIDNTKPATIFRIEF